MQWRVDDGLKEAMEKGLIVELCVKNGRRGRGGSST